MDVGYVLIILGFAIGFPIYAITRFNSERLAFCAPFMVIGITAAFILAIGFYLDPGVDYYVQNEVNSKCIKRIDITATRHNYQYSNCNENEKTTVTLFGAGKNEERENQLLNAFFVLLGLLWTVLTIYMVIYTAIENTKPKGRGMK